MTTDDLGKTVVQRRTAAAIAGHLADQATARAALDDPSPSVRATALAALARMQQATGDDVRAGLADADPAVRRRAVEVAIPFAEVDLVVVLHDADDLVVEAAAWGLGERARDEGAVAALSSVAESHDEPLCREAAAAALGAIGDPAGLPALLVATRDKPAVRRRAVIALAPFEGDEVTAALQRALTDRDWQVRQAAEDLLADD